MPPNSQSVAAIEACRPQRAFATECKSGLRCLLSGTCQSSDSNRSKRVSSTPRLSGSTQAGTLHNVRSPRQKCPRSNPPPSGNGGNVSSRSLVHRWPTSVDRPALPKRPSISGRRNMVTSASPKSVSSADPRGERAPEAPRGRSDPRQADQILQEVLRKKP